MKIKNLDRWSEDDYYPKKQKIKRKKSRKEDLDSPKGERILKTTKK